MTDELQGRWARRQGRPIFNPLDAVFYFLSLLLGLLLCPLFSVFLSLSLDRSLSLWHTARG